MHAIGELQLKRTQSGSSSRSERNPGAVEIGEQQLKRTQYRGAVGIGEEQPKWSQASGELQLKRMETGNSSHEADRCNRGEAAGVDQCNRGEAAGVD